MRNEDYGRISRILADGTPVELEFNIVNRTYPEGRTSYNVIGELPGTDKKDEVVMLGGHLDSWHAATGATDNAIGCATMMEASASNRAARFAWRCGAGKSRGCLARRHTSGNTSDRSRIRSLSLRNSPVTSTSTAALAARAE